MIGDGVRPTAWGTPYSSARFAPSARFLPDVRDVPAGASAYIAAQLGLPDVSSLAQYAERGQTHREHTARDPASLRLWEFAKTRSELESWLERRAWNRGDGPRVLFEAAWQWLRERRVLLPGITTLTRLVASIRERATQRLWETLAGKLTFHIFAALAEFERDMIRERTSAGLAAAHKRGVAIGRPRALTPEQILMAEAMTADPAISTRQVAEQFGVQPLDALSAPQRSSERLRLACKIAPICLIPNAAMGDLRGQLAREEFCHDADIIGTTDHS